MVAVADLKSAGPKGPCGFESHLLYKTNLLDQNQTGHCLTESGI